MIYAKDWGYKIDWFYPMDWGQTKEWVSKRDWGRMGQGYMGRARTSFSTDRACEM
jgi:hypothetical protein